MSKGDHSPFLSQIRKNFSGRYTMKAVVAILVFGMIIAVFVLSDLSGRAGGRGGHLGAGAAATVNGEIISIKQFQDHEARIANYYSQLFGGKMDNEFQRRQIMAETMSQLVNDQVAYQAARREGIYATDADLRKALLDIPAFKKDGVFQTELYKNLLAANRLTPAEFENSLRQQISLQKVRGLFELGSQPSQLEKKFEKDLKSQQINVYYAALTADIFKNTKAISDSEVQSALAKEDFKKKVQEDYSKNKAEFSTPEKIRASHILVRANAQDAAEMQKAKAKAEALLVQVRKGDFGKIAAQNSDDPGSKTKNGDLGFFSRGRMAKEFEEAAFQLNKGQISNVVQSPFGYHIIKLTDKTPASELSQAQAEQQIARKLLAEEKYLAMAKSLEKATAEGNSAEVEKILNDHKIAWKESGYFDLSSETFPQVQSATLFKSSLDLNHKAPYSKTLVREGDTQYVLKLKDIKSSQVTETPGSSDLLTKQKSFGSYQNWVDHHRSQARIETNNALLQ